MAVGNVPFGEKPVLLEKNNIDTIYDENKSPSKTINYNTPNAQRDARAAKYEAELDAKGLIKQSEQGASYDY